MTTACNDEGPNSYDKNNSHTRADPLLVSAEIDAHLKFRPSPHHDAPLIASQRNERAFSNVTLSMLFRQIYEMAGIRTSSHSGRRTFATRLNAKGVGMRTIQKLMGHRHIVLYCDVQFTSGSRAPEGWISLADPKLNAQLADLGGIILGGSPADFRTLIADETEKWGKVIRAANIKPE